MLDTRSTQFRVFIIQYHVTADRHAMEMLTVGFIIMTFDLSVTI